MTQEALLGLIEDYTQKAVTASLADALVGRGGPERQDASAAHMVMLDAVRSLPIEAGR